MGKVWEEMKEFENEVKNDSKHHMTKEFGDLLFALINVARFHKIFPEEALAMTNTKFYRRFSYVEEQVLKAGRLSKTIHWKSWINIGMKRKDEYRIRGNVKWFR